MSVTLEQFKEDYYSAAMVHRLKEGDFFKIFYKNEWHNIKFKEGLLYEVVKVYHDMKSPTGIVLIKGVYVEWKETGKFYTPDEWNKMLMKESRSSNE